MRRQAEDCERLAAAKRWEVVDRYVDDDVSAYNGHVRPEYRRMLGDLRDGYLDAVVVWHLDRLSRQPRELEEFFDLCDSVGVTRLASVPGDIDLATHDGQFLARILGAVAKKESDDKSRYVCAKGPNFTGCGHMYIEADTLELFVVEAVLHRLDSPGLAAALNGARGDPDVERAQAEVEQAQTQLDELAAAYGSQAFGLSEWLAARRPIEQRLTQAKRQLARLGRVSVLEGHAGHAPAAGALARPAPHEAARDRRCRPRLRRRRSRPARVQPLRPRPPDPRMEGLSLRRSLPAGSRHRAACADR